jgi:DNA-binding LytR/AlgR family response regulator
MALLFLATLFRMSGTMRESTGAGFFPELGAQLFLYALAVAGAFVTRTFVQKSDRDRERDRLALEKSQLEASLRQAELQTLRMRLNPHFLFNTLQNISVLTEHDPTSASQMLSRLGDLLRASFRSDFQAEVPFETELVHKSLAAQLQMLLDQRKDDTPDRLVVRNGGRYEFVPIESVDWIESANNFVQLHCGGRTHLLSDTMSRIEKKLDSRMFVRVHRCRIVNVSRIVAVHTGMDETFDIELRSGLRLSSGKQFKKAVQSLIGR